MAKAVDIYCYVNKLVYSYEVNGVFIHGSIEWKGGEKNGSDKQNTIDN